MMDSVIEAVRYAAVMHHGQLRSGTNDPYIVHPLDVMHILLRYGYYSPVTLEAAVLHDVLEDTEATFEDLEKRFGFATAKLVLEVTDDPSISKKEQRERLVERVAGMSRQAKLIKIADGISNIRDTDYTRPAGWERSLKLAYVKTTEKVGEECAKEFESSNPMIDHFRREVAAAKERLSKGNYGP